MSKTKVLDQALLGGLKKTAEHLNDTSQKFKDSLKDQGLSIGNGY
jgi:hypothetical protein